MLNQAKALRTKIAEVEVTPEQMAQSPEVKRNTVINAKLGSIALAGSVLEASYSQIESSTEMLLEIFEKHGKETSDNQYEINIPKDQYLLVETDVENFTVEGEAWILKDTGIRKFPTSKLRYTNGGSFGHHIDASLYAGGINDTWVEIKNGHRLSLRQLPKGVSLEEFLGIEPEH